MPRAVPSVCQEARGCINTQESVFNSRGIIKGELLSTIQTEILLSEDC